MQSAHRNLVLTLAVILSTTLSHNAEAGDPLRGDDPAAAADQRMADQALKNWDVNRDGSLDIHEILKVPGPALIVRVWFRHDSNKDGRLTRDELARHWAEQRGAKSRPRLATADPTPYFPRLSDKPRAVVHLDDELRLTKYSPNGRYLAAAGRNAIHILDATTGKSIHRIRGHSSRCISVDFSPDSKTLVSASRDRTAKFWNVLTGRQIGEPLVHGQQLFWAMFSPDGLSVVTAPDSNAQSTVDVWAVPYGPKTLSLRGATGTVTRLAFLPQGNLLASAEWDGSGVHVWNFRSGELVWSKKHSGHAVCVEFSPDGKTLATGGWDNVVRLWNADSGKHLRTIRPPGGTPVETVLWWPSGNWLVSGSRNGTIAVLDVKTGKTLQHFEAHEQVRGLALSLDNKTVASCSPDKTLKLWDVQSRSRRKR